MDGHEDLLGRVRDIAASSTTPLTTSLRQDTIRFAAAIAIVLERHQPRHVYGFAGNPDRGQPCDCGHAATAGCHFRPDGGAWRCLCKPEGIVCGTCTDPEGGTLADWPCPEYTDVRNALAGQPGTAPAARENT